MKSSNYWIYEDFFIFKPEFNCSINQLVKLEQLIFNYYFNQPLSDLLNQLIKLEELTLGYNFNLLIEIPPNIKILKLDCNNIHLIDNLPNSIYELHFLENFN